MNDLALIPELDALVCGGMLAVNEYPQREGLPADISMSEFLALPATDEQLVRRRKIYAAQRALMVDADADLVGPPPVHLLVPGVMYYRELTIPAGQFVVSRRHGREHLCIVSRGEALVFTEDGTTLIRGPHRWASAAGAKRTLLVTEEIVWATVHRVAALTVEDAEREVIIDDRELLQ